MSLMKQNYRSFRIVTFLLVLLAHALQNGAQAQGFRSIYYPNPSSIALSRFVEEVSPGNYLAIGLSAAVNYSTTLEINGIDANGNIIWAKRYGDSSSYFLHLFNHARQAIKHQNYVYYAGLVRQGSEQNGAFLKIKFNGDTVWQKIFKETNWTTCTQMVAPSIDGGFLLTGFAEHITLPGRPALLMKTDANGNLLWKKKINKPGWNVVFGNSVIQDPISKKILITGYCYGVDPDSLFPYMIVTDSLGTIINQQIVGQSQGNLLDLTRLSDGSYVAVGAAITDSMDVSNALNLQLSMAVRFDAGFNVISINYFDRLSPSNYFTSVNACATGAEYITTGCLDTCEMYFPPYKYNEMLRITRFTASAVALQSRTYDYSMFVDKNKPYFDHHMYCNHFAPTSDGGWIAAILIDNYSVRVPFFNVKFDSGGCDSTLAYCANMVALSVLNKSNSLMLFPNPCHAELHVSIEGELNQSHTLKIFDVLGRNVFTQRLDSTEFTVNLSSLPSGVYEVSVLKEGRTISVQKLIISR